MARLEIRGGRPVRALTDSGKVLAEAKQPTTNSKWKTMRESARRIVKLANQDWFHGDGKQAELTSHAENLAQGILAEPAPAADPWKDDLTQFSRLIDELAAAGVFGDKEIMGTLRDSMDLSTRHIKQLVERARRRFEAVKAELLSHD